MTKEQDRSAYFRKYQNNPQVKKRRRTMMQWPRVRHRIRHQQRVRRRRANRKFRYYTLLLLDILDQAIGGPDDD